MAFDNYTNEELSRFAHLRALEWFVSSCKAFRQASELLTDFEELAALCLGMRNFVGPYPQRLAALL